jgi:hypothetical protein
MLPGYLARGRGPDRRRSGPQRRINFSHHFNALASVKGGIRFSAYSQLAISGAGPRFRAYSQFLGGICTGCPNQHSAIIGAGRCHATRDNASIVFQFEIPAPWAPPSRSARLPICSPGSKGGLLWTIPKLKSCGMIRHPPIFLTSRQRSSLAKWPSSNCLQISTRGGRFRQVSCQFAKLMAQNQDA